MDFPRILMSALRGGSGKTILSIGIVAAWKQQDKSVHTFKKGPDYIDAGWLALAAGRPCHNLDTFLVPQDLVYHSFFHRMQPDTLAVIEGNRGLYDGTDTEGSTSTAELAKLLKVPVVLIVDCTKSTRTMAAAVLGCLKFDPEVLLKGVIVNRVAGTRHESTLRKNIEYHCGIPVLGAVPKLQNSDFPERHMGLLPIFEHDWASESIAAAADVARKYLDLDKLALLAAGAPAMPQPPSGPGTTLPRQGGAAASIGVIRDSAFQFYYPENLEALEKAGARLVYISPLVDDRLHNLDALYLGGGFPETHVEALAKNETFRHEIKALADKGFPIYAECGGLMYLGETIRIAGNSYPMCGVLPIGFGFSKRPQGHGYTVVRVERENPYFAVGSEIRGHEFHYSTVEDWRGTDDDLAFSMQRGTGFTHGRDGVVYKNVFATYTHIHALGTPQWAGALVENARKYNNNLDGRSIPTPDIS